MNGGLTQPQKDWIASANGSRRFVPEEQIRGLVASMGDRNLQERFQDFSDGKLTPIQSFNFLDGVSGSLESDAEGMVSPANLDQLETAFSRKYQGMNLRQGRALSEDLRNEAMYYALTASGELIQDANLKNEIADYFASTNTGQGRLALFFNVSQALWKGTNDLTVSPKAQNEMSLLYVDISPELLQLEGQDLTRETNSSFDESCSRWDSRAETLWGRLLCIL
jgi:hypothetical protein